jgi:hypothetical protein
MPDLAGARDACREVWSRAWGGIPTSGVADSRVESGDAPTEGPFRAGDLLRGRDCSRSSSVGTGTTPARNQIVIYDGRKVTVGPQRRQTAHLRRSVACARCGNRRDKRSETDVPRTRGASPGGRRAVLGRATGGWRCSVIAAPVRCVTGRVRPRRDGRRVLPTGPAGSAAATARRPARASRPAGRTSRSPFSGWPGTPQ